MKYDKELGIQIPKHWEVVRIEEIGQVIGGGTPSTKQEDYYGGNIPWVTPKDLSGYSNKYILKGERNITEIGLKKSSARLMPANTVLLSSRAPIGYVAIAANELCTNQGFKSVICDESKIYPEFLYYIFKISKRRLESIASGTTFKEISGRKVKEFKIPLPSLNEQFQIINILNHLDSKIELNNSIISNLEDLAQTLFKRWFVEFEFPNEEGKPYKSSGGKMVESELGMIPEGWEIEALGNITEIQNGYAFKSKDYVSEGVKVLRTLNIDEKGLLIRDNDLKYLPESFYQNDRFKKQRLQQYDTLLVMVGSTIGKLGVVLTSNLPSLQNQNMWRFRSKRLGVNNPYIYLLLQNLIGKMMGYKSGSAREFFRKESFLKEKVVIPNIILLDNMKVFIDLFEQINKLHSENESLNEVRDTLLPKLLSGEIELPNDMEVTDDVPIS